MPVDVKGYKVIYGDRAYRCLQVEPYWDASVENPQDGIQKPWRLRVSIIDHESHFVVIDDYYEYFAFVKEATK